jgi:protein-disulfide isomerase
MSASDNRETKVSPLLTGLTLFLLLAAVASNAYLGVLYAEIQTAGDAKVESFCSMGENADCVTVARSPYAAVAKVPLALLAFEFYGLALGFVLLSLLGWWRVKRWDSLLWWMMVIGLPVSLLMGGIAIFVIRSLCILCTGVYTTNIILLLLLTVANRGRLGALVKEGPRQLSSALKSGPGMVGTALVLIIGIGQFAVVPKLFGESQTATKVDLKVLDGLVISGMTVGPTTAPIKLEEFSDYECPICALGHKMVLKVLSKYPNKIHFQHRDYPLDKRCNRKIDRAFHNNACKAAYFARCAAEQGKYWPYSGDLFANQHNLSWSELEGYGRAHKLDMAKLSQCVKSQSTRQAVLDDVEEGIRRKIEGTPTFFLNGEKIVGPHDMEFWRKKIDALLK